MSRTYLAPSWKFTAAAILVAVSTLLACGPADESVQRELGNLPSTAPQETSDYPNLDATLQDIVRQYEAGDVTETEAAELVPEHHDDTVLVQVDLPTNLDDVYTWLEGKGATPLHKELELNPPAIYGFVRVSLLGTLSQQTNVELVSAPAYPFSEGVAYTVPGPNPVRSASDPAVFPPWLKGSAPSPGTYPKLRSGLDRVLGSYLKGTFDAEAAEVGTLSCRWYDSKLGVLIGTAIDTDADDRIVTWLRDQGVSDLETNIDDIPNEATVTGAGIPISLLASLNNHEDVLWIDTVGCPDVSSYDRTETDRMIQEGFGTIGNKYSYKNLPSSST